MEMMLQTQNLCKYFKKQKAVNKVSLNIEKGKIYGLLGPNGAGKSTTMNMLTGYIAPTEGRILIDAIDMVEKPEKAKKHIGYLPEIPPLYPDMRVREYLQFVAELKKVPRNDRAEKVNLIMKKTIKVVIIGIILISCIIIGVNAQKSVEKMEEKKIDSQINISEEIIPEEKVESEDR